MNNHHDHGGSDAQEAANANNKFVVLIVVVTVMMRVEKVYKYCLGGPSSRRFEVLEDAHLGALKPFWLSKPSMDRLRP